MRVFGYVQDLQTNIEDAFDEKSYKSTQELIFSVYHHALAGKFPHVWDPPQVLFSGHGTEATHTDVKAREKSAVELFAICQLCSVGGR